MGDAVSSSNASELPGGNQPLPREQPEEEGRRQPPEEEGQEQEHEGGQRVFNLASYAYTPKMWMSDLERFRGSDDDIASSPYRETLMYPVHAAAGKGRTDIVKLMLGKGYDKDVLDHEGYTPLQSAALMGHVTTAQALLAAGADVSIRCRDSDGTALHIAATFGFEDIARLIIGHGADVNAATSEGATSLHVAATVGRADMVTLLVSEGASVDALDEGGKTPLHKAAFRGHAAVAHALLAAGADLSIQFHSNDLSALVSALDVAIIQGHEDTAKTIIEHGADVNLVSSQGATPIHLAAVANNAGMVRLLASNGAAVDALDGDGATALQKAAFMGSRAGAEALISAGADIDARNEDEGSALHLALHRGHADVARLLVRSGADVRARSGGGVSALLLAAISDEPGLTEFLIEAGADVNEGLVNTGNTPLHITVNNGNPEGTLILLRHGASIGARNEIGRSPLHMAACNAGSLGTATVVDILLRRGADEKARDNEGGTAADMVGRFVADEDSVEADVERVRELLANAPADRAWRRRGFLVLCRAHYPSGRVQLARSCQARTRIAKRTRSSAGLPRADIDWAGVARMLMGVGADPISLMGDGADIIFETIVGFL